MWDESFGKGIAYILNLMADKPNLRPDPSAGATDLFDGGQWTVMSGLIKYEFSDGSTAVYGTELEWSLTIRLATGEEVVIKVPKAIELPEPNNCQTCCTLIVIGKNTCNRLVYA